MYRLVCLAALTLTAAALAAPVPKEVKKRPADLNGTWEVVEYHTGGNKVNLANTKWVIDGESLQIQRNNAALPGKLAVTYSLKKPQGGADNALDYVLTYDENAGRPPRTNPGVFELDGDTLKFCWSSRGERPTECKPDQTNFMYVFKRVDPAK